MCTLGKDDGKAGKAKVEEGHRQNEVVEKECKKMVKIKQEIGRTGKC